VLAWIGNRIGKPPGWERVVRTLAPPDKCRGVPELCLARDDLLFFAQPGVPIGWYVTFFGTYEPALRTVCKAILQPGAVALDIGANVGWHTLLMARLVGAGGHVLAVEANPSVRDRLQRNLDLNRFRQVEVVPCAIADSEGTFEFHGPAADDPDSGNGHLVGPNGPVRAETMRVEARRLDAIAAHLDRIDLIKIDIEGFEWPALRGGAKSIATFRPHIIFEYNAEYAGRGGGSPGVLQQFFDLHDYRLFALEREWAKAITADRWPDCADVWAIPH
jgi:FkbM family methyltransferase